MLTLKPISLKEANAFVAIHHRHLQKVVGHKLSIGIEKNAELRGVVIAGRPSARMLDNGYTLEVTRCCTDGVRNGCSKLYAAAWRAAKSMGYNRMVTYILESESGVSLNASGFRMVGESKGGTWSRKNRKRRNPVQGGHKKRFEIHKELE